MHARTCLSSHSWCSYPFDYFEGRMQTMITCPTTSLLQPALFLTWCVLWYEIALPLMPKWAVYGRYKTFFFLPHRTFRFLFLLAASFADWDSSPVSGNSSTFTCCTWNRIRYNFFMISHELDLKFSLFGEGLGNRTHTTFRWTRFISTPTTFARKVFLLDSDFSSVALAVL